MSSTPLLKCIPSKKFEQYEKVCLPYKRHEKYSEYDIVYYCGGLSIEWDPKKKSLGGSEQAVVELSSYWASQGNKVIVYANLTQDETYRGVDYKTINSFKASLKYKKLILWRSFGFISAIQWNIKADYSCLDLHDTGAPPILHEHIDKLDHIYVKSNYHKEKVIETNPENIRNKLKKEN